MTDSAEPSRRAGLIVAALVCLATLAAWWPLTDLALLGWDSYPLIAASRIGSVSELFGTFGEELMDGRYPLAHFWRPVVHLAFAFDHALWGLDPFGYHLTDLLLVAASAALLSGLTGRLFGGVGVARWGAGLVAGLVWALHPVQFEILTAAPRRAESLAVWFSLWALFCHARAPLHPGPWRRAGVALLCALALGSKEAGVAAALAVVLYSLCASEQRGASASARLGNALRATWPTLLLVVATLGLRSAVLGGLGGSEHSSPIAGVANLGPLAVEYARGVLVPSNVFPGATPAAALGALIVLVLVVLLASRSPGSGPGLAQSGLAQSGAAQPQRGGALFLGLWSLALLAITGMSGILQGWYALPLVAVYALALGLVTARALGALSRRPVPAAAGAGLLLGQLVALAGLGVSVAGSGFFDRAEDFRAVSDLQNRFLARFERKVAATAGDQMIQMEGCPAEIYVTRGEVLERMIFALGPYSLEAYAELSLPRRYVRVSFPGFESRLPARPGEVRVGVIPKPLRFDR